MIPVLTPQEMRAVDEGALEPLEVLIGRAGAAVARQAVVLLGGAYGRRVVVVAGRGNNGADGRDAATRLRRLGAHVRVVDANQGRIRIPRCDLMIDAAYGTGFHGQYTSPDPDGARVLAVDIPSGVDGLTGEAGDGVVAAEATVTFAALKPGLLWGRGRELVGRVTVADIGLDVSSARAHVVEDGDIHAWLPARPTGAHKWQSAVWVVAGSPGMTGAATLAARSAQRSGAGYVRLSVPGGNPGEGAPIEAVGLALPAEDWAEPVLADVNRFKAVVVGPGLGRSEATTNSIRHLVAKSPVPVVVDGDGLSAFEDETGGRSAASVVLTPHDGEFERITGSAPPPDRLEAVRKLSAGAGAIVLLKGPTSVIADVDGSVLMATAGDARLATAGSGDVLSGLIGALVAQGVSPHRAAAAGAHIHGRAGALGPVRGLVAGDLIHLIQVFLSTLGGGGKGTKGH